MSEIKKKTRNHESIVFNANIKRLKDEIKFLNIDLLSFVCIRIWKCMINNLIFGYDNRKASFVNVAFLFSRFEFIIGFLYANVI